MPLWTRLLSYTALVGVGFLLGMFYSDQKFRQTPPTQIVDEHYVAPSACPSYTLRRIEEVLQNESVAVPETALRKLKAERRDLVARICPPQSE